MKIWENGIFEDDKRTYNNSRPQFKVADMLLSGIELNGKTCLDVGCGLGEFVNTLNQRGGGNRRGRVRAIFTEIG